MQIFVVKLSECKLTISHITALGNFGNITNVKFPQFTQLKQDVLHRVVEKIKEDSSYKSLALVHVHMLGLMYISLSQCHVSTKHLNQCLSNKISFGYLFCFRVVNGFQTPKLVGHKGQKDCQAQHFGGHILHLYICESV